MFIGHYAPAFVGKTIAKTVPLWVLFAAVQLVDIGWGVFIATGVEHVRIIDGFTASNDFDLYDMPWTHSLLMAAIWAIVAGYVWSLIARSDKRTGGLVVGAAVFSHWLIDLLVHVPDLALFPGSEIKLGFGIWNNAPLAIGLELAFILIGMTLYVTSTTPKSTLGKVWPFVGGGLLIALYGVGMTVAPPPDMVAVGASSIGMYLIMCGIAAVFDATRDAQ
ncbi:MAG: hypothetical protein P8J78_05850 [Maricaulis sp.]|jgi:hypothetical protein|nr:hypothetical protein [Maricaulis sp.]MDG2044114.1 hypothetical protein [Maricaulis sp.]